MDKIFIAIITAIICFFVGKESLAMLLPIAVGVLNGWINSTPFNKYKVGKLWHNLQLGILIVIVFVLMLFKVILWDEILLVIAFYHTAFEVSLNLIEKRDWNYVGKTAIMDKTIRKIFKTEGSTRTFFVASKYLLIFIGMGIYLTNKPF